MGEREVRVEREKDAEKRMERITRRFLAPGARLNLRLRRRSSVCLMAKIQQRFSYSNKQIS
jgi:hypothetical protein